MTFACTLVVDLWSIHGMVRSYKKYASPFLIPFFFISHIDGRATLEAFSLHSYRVPSIGTAGPFSPRYYHFPAMNVLFKLLLELYFRLSQNFFVRC